MTRLILPLLILCSSAWAETDIMEASMMDLINPTSTLANKRETSVRESPGIISVVTREQILNAGVRDLRETLTLFVPGISFGMDVENGLGIAVRGLSGHEGKVLLMMDGVPLNEEVYSTTQFGNHYPAELIERVEVLRGPGSVIHGNYALIGAINIISRKPENGAFASIRYSQMSDTFSHRNVTAGVGGGSDFKYSLLISGGEGTRTQEDYVDINGTRAEMGENAALNPKIANLGLEWKGFTFRAIYDRYDTTHFQTLDVIPTDGIKHLETYETQNYVLSYRGNLTENFQISPYFQYRETRPWWVDSVRSDPNDDWLFQKVSKRLVAGVSTDWKITDSFNLLSGIEYSTVRISGENGDTFYNHESLFHQFEIVYAEGTWRTAIGDLVLGGRYEKPNDFDAAFVPRIGLSKAMDRWHYKGMLSQSFRVPAGLHLDLPYPGAEDVKPEIATNIELETGARLTTNSYLTLSLFDIKINDTIVYTSDAAAPDGAYFNGGAMGTRGAELEYRYAVTSWDVAANAAYYRRTHDVSNWYGVPGQPQAYVGMPNYRVNLITGYKVNSKFGIYPSFTYEGERYGFVSDLAGGTVLEKRDPAVYMNLNLRHTDFLVKGLEISAGVMNLGGERQVNYQTYEGGFPATPGLSRAYNVMLGYNTTF